MCLISVSGRYPGGEHGNPLQYPCLEKSMDRGAWGATVYEVTKELDTTEATQRAHILCINQHLTVYHTLFVKCFSICPPGFTFS